MTKKEIYQLLKNGYKEMCATGEDNPFLVFYTNVGMSLIYVLCGNAKRYKEEEYNTLKQSFDKQIQNMGGETKSFLVLSVNSSEADYTEQLAVAKQVCDSKQFCWIFDDYLNELVVYDTQVEEFYGLRRVLSEASSVTDEESEKVIQQEYYESEDGRVTTKTPVSNDKTPVVAISLIVINFVVLIICHFTGELLYNIGVGFSTMFGEPKYWYRLITAMFLHEDLYHFFSNAILLFVVALNIEPVLKPAKFIGIYIASGLIGNIGEMLATYLRGEEVIFYGASGAVFGMVGAYIALMIFKRIIGVMAGRIWVMLGLSIMLMTGLFATDVANAAHVIGFLSGLLITVLICAFTKTKNEGKRNEN